MLSRTASPLLRLSGRRLYTTTPSFPLPPVATHFINGAYTPPGSSPTFTNYAPATGDALNEVSIGTASDVDLAVSSAKEAFPEWAAKSGAERGRILKKAADLIREHNHHLHMLESVDAGIPGEFSCRGFADARSWSTRFPPPLPLPSPPLPPQSLRPNTCKC